MNHPDEPTPDESEVVAERYVGGKDLTTWTSRIGAAAAAFVHRLSLLLGPHAALILILAFGAAVATAATLGAAKIYDAVTDRDGVAGLDQPLLGAALQVRSPWLNLLATYYTELGGVVIMPIIATLAIIALAVRRKSWTPVVIIAGTAIGSLLMTVVGKDLIGRTRPALADAVPPYELSPSFPSGHTLNATAIAGAIAYLLVLRQSTRTARWLTIAAAAAFAITIGMTRIYLGHHWFTDVLVAWALGVAWLATVITAHRLYLTARKREAAT